MVSKKVVTQLPPVFGRGSGRDLSRKRRFMVGSTVWVLSVLLIMMLGWGDSALAAKSTTNLAASTTSAATQSSKSTSRSSTSVTSDLAAVPAMPPDIERILDRGKLIVAVLGQDNAPFFMDRQGHLSGLDLELARSLADQLGVSLEVTRSAQTFNQVVDTVYEQKADLAVSKISRTLKRAQKVRFSRPYLRMRQGLLVNRLQVAEQTQGRSMVETIRDLQGQVGVIQGSSYVGFLKQKFPQATIVEYPTWEATVEAVVQGDILAAYRDELEIKKVVRNQPHAALQLQTIALTDTQDVLAVVLPWSSTHLLAFVDQYLDSLATQYTVDTVLDEYADYWATQPAQQP
jgi:polar amino acid transport system substrate-binding protein